MKCPTAQCAKIRKDYRFVCHPQALMAPLHLSSIQEHRAAVVASGASVLAEYRYSSMHTSTRQLAARPTISTGIQERSRAGLPDRGEKCVCDTCVGTE